MSGAGADVFSVVEFIAGARRRRNLRSGLESLALGVAAALIALAAIRFTGSADFSAHASPWALAACAAISGLAMAGTWWVERAKKSDLELTRQIDARLGRDGALTTAYEARVQGNVGPLADLLEQRVLAALDRASLQRALPALGFIWLAPPAIGAALLALALELPVQPTSATDETASGGTLLAGNASRANARANSALDRAQAQQAAARNDPGLQARLIDDLDAAAREVRAGMVDSTSTEAAHAADLLQKLQTERDSLDPNARATRTDLNASSHGPGNGSKAPAGRAGNGSDEEPGKSLLTNGSPDRTMSGSNRPTAGTSGEPSATQAPDSGSPGEAGTLAGRWWDERYDPVVQGWRRALAARREQH